MAATNPMPERSIERLRVHFEIEKGLAGQLKSALREGRPAIYARMYDELFAAVPDHPRLVRRENPSLVRERLNRELRLLRKWIRPQTSFLEFGAGDCRLSLEISRYVERVVAVDISDQRGTSVATPRNFQLVVYDGYHLEVPDRSVDVVFSQDMIEHLHPEDVELHFRIVHRLLRAGGHYVFTTPQRLNGPHDVSRYFSEEPLGFHLAEWTFTELDLLLRRCGYSGTAFYRFAKGVPVRQPSAAIFALEAGIGRLPRAARLPLCRIFLPGIVVRADR
jgi:SAM-dependent methyltransferase